MFTEIKKNNFLKLGLPNEDCDHSVHLFHLNQALGKVLKMYAK